MAKKLHTNVYRYYSSKKMYIDTIALKVLLRSTKDQVRLYILHVYGCNQSCI